MKLGVMPSRTTKRPEKSSKKERVSILALPEGQLEELVAQRRDPRLTGC
jgi:hypothetical protein